jgi:hypothetical protein
MFTWTVSDFIGPIIVVGSVVLSLVVMIGALITRWRNK